jgi:hypothetical protein
MLVTANSVAALEMPPSEVGDSGVVIPTPSPKVEPVYEIEINLPGFELTLLRDGEVFRRFPVAVGRPATPSLVGAYRIVNKAVNPTWYPKGRKPVPPGPGNPIGPRWMGLSIPDYGIHGTNAPQSIGSAASGGCIRMPNLAVEDIFSLVKVGTPVTIKYESIAVEPATLTESDAGASLPREREFPWRLTVHPDVYNRKVNTVLAALAKVRQAGVEARVDEARLAALLKSDGLRKTAVPAVSTASLGGKAYSQSPWFRGSEAMLPIGESQELAGGDWPLRGGERTDAALEVIDVNGVGYAPAWQIAGALGHRIRYAADAEHFALETAQILVDGQPVGFAAAWLEGDFRVPLGKLAQLVGATLDDGAASASSPQSDAASQSASPDSDEPSGVEFAGDRYVLPVEAAGLLRLELLTQDPSQGDPAPISFRLIRADAGPPDISRRRD